MKPRHDLPLQVLHQIDNSSSSSSKPHSTFSCYLCDESHPLRDCPRFKRLKMDKRAITAMKRAMLVAHLDIFSDTEDDSPSSTTPPAADDAEADSTEFIDAKFTLLPFSFRLYRSLSIIGFLISQLDDTQLSPSE